MANSSCIYLYLICILSLFRSFVASVTYKNFSLDRAEICPLTFNVPEIRVGKDEQSSVIVHDGNYFKKWTGETKFECKFIIRTGFGLSLISVIQNMNLRKDENSGECIDYIQFGSPKHKLLNLENFLNMDIYRDKWDDPKLCGSLSKYDWEDAISMPDDLHPYSYKSKKGVIYVKIHIERKPIPINMTLNLNMAFTAYKECRFSEGSFRMCQDNICINKNYMNDFVVNCPACDDETSCFPEPQTGGDPELNTKVTVTAVTSIFLSFFLFLGCMMLCRYFLLFRQWHQPPPVTTVEMTPPPEDTSQSPSAPPPTNSDKDLPPAYETLFPDR